MHSFKNYFFVIGLLLFNTSIAQNYQALNGSPYAGSLAPGSNPSSIVQVPYSWDITLVAFQLKQSSNAFKINNFSLLSSPKNVEIKAVNGIKKRFVFANQDIHLLNARFSLSSKTAIAFGANLRNYVYGTTSKTNWQDTSYSLADFLKINVDYIPLSADAGHSTWAELYATYAKTIFTDGNKTLNAGITINYNRAISGSFSKIRNVNYTPSVTSETGYLLTTGSLQYGYSANFDQIDSNKTFAANRNIFLQNNSFNLGAAIGIEYIIQTEPDINLDKDLVDAFAYHTKIGVSLMDIGHNKFKYGSRSRLGFAGLQGITDTLVENKFKTVNSLDKFNETISTIAASYTPLAGDFYIYKPTRLVVNVDQHLLNNFFINAEITVPLLPFTSKKTIYIRDINFFAITPRWETKNLGVYFPLLFNNRQQLWMGAAFKVGPLLLGTHNLGILFSKNTAQSGGAYLAFTIRPGKNHDRQLHDPSNTLSSKTKRSLKCPSF